MNPEQSVGEFTGLILAGGQSRRFGSNKALHPIKGKPMIQWVYDALKSVCDTILVSCQDAALFDLEAGFVADAYPNSGPLAGLEAGLRTSTTPWTIVLPVDMPYIEPALLDQLKQACINGLDAECDAVLVRDQFGIQPLVGCYHKRVHATVNERLKKEDYAVMPFLRTLNYGIVELPETSLININKLKDLSSGS